VCHCFKVFPFLRQSGVVSNICAAGVKHGVLQVVEVYAEYPMGRCINSVRS
jgi:hypothetical protein